ncbi:XRE family transcriptional regulator [Bacillus sp. FJAT-47783]|uniref:helix-turn-helix domain-containing protein n=1 Tax=Bacillus sp. FJAT-47783 TaxID=2922712 RepID=UPI001FADDCCA|nr:XRE family transcriptional regulator [Bacillus sp. FJAT-47783]
MESIQQNIAKNLSKIRKEKGLSLDKTSELTGVSKAMLGQIERGESNPTVSTLWKISNGLHVSFSSLMKEETKKVKIVSKNRVAPVIDEDGKYQVFPLFPYEFGKQFEVFSVTLDAHYAHEAEGHLKGVEEYILVQKGTLDFSVNGELYRLTEGEAIHFQADEPHIYRNSTDVMTHFTVIIYYPES